jgi:hypothetical protein
MVVCQPWKAGPGVPPSRVPFFRARLPVAMLLVGVLLTWAVAWQNSAFGDEPSVKPNIIVIFADDKYELGQSKIENTRKNRPKLALHR